jgi:[ribosomal protein S18]-alanine N-acetyltransferase
MVTIRLAKVGDCRRCTELSRTEELKVNDGFIPEDYFRNFVDEDKMFFVAEDKGVVVGFVLGEPMKGKLANLGLLSVDPSHRGKGIGTRLVDAFRERCTAMGLKYRLVYARADCADTVNFYVKAGFRKGKPYQQFFDQE